MTDNPADELLRRLGRQFERELAQLTHPAAGNPAGASVPTIPPALGRFAARVATQLLLNAAAIRAVRKLVDGLAAAGAPVEPLTRKQAAAVWYPAAAIVGALALRTRTENR